MDYTVLLFYKYVTIKDPEALMLYVRGLAEGLSLKGRAIIAEEGINMTFEGLSEDTERFVAVFTQDKRFKDIQIKRSAGNGKAFPKLSVKVRDEIVGTRFPKEIDPRKKTGTYLAPEKLKEWFQKSGESAQEDFVIVDMRNDYEFWSGHFKNSIDPGMQASRDLPQAIEKLKIHQDKKILTVCTGGVRCEKMSAFLLANGFKDVYQLDGGIHSYMEKYPGEDFVGTLYTFDNRDTMHFGGDREVVGTCRLCGEKTEDYYNCANDECHRHFLACTDCAPGEHVFCSDTCQTSAVRLTVSKR
jgi:UPF0176 protein